MSVLTDIAGALAPLVRADRHALDMVRFIGSPTELRAFASDGHVLAMVTVLGDFSRVGEMTLPGEIAQRIGNRDWAVEQWSGPDFDSELTADDHLRLDADGDLTLAMIQKVMPRSKAPTASAGWFLGPALSTAASVIYRLGARVQFSGSDGERDPIRLDSRPDELSEGGNWWWVSLAVMPGKAVGP